MKYFGTDGIRGIANDELTSELAYKAGFGAAEVLTKNKSHRCKFFIGRDTRISGNMLECALAAGICAAGADVYLLGVLPTPAVAFLSVKHGADAGIVISASHNPFEHNGIKIFGFDGFKLSDETEMEIEALIDHPDSKGKTGGEIGTVIHFEHEGAEEYAQHICACVQGDLRGLRILADCSNGAASHTARMIFNGLHIPYTLMHNEPNGVNINEQCGSTHMDLLAQHVKMGGYDLGVAFDGDADRCLLVDEKGNLIDGDLIMGLMARHMKQENTLKGGVVATVMSNLGLHMFLRANDIALLTSKVGDRYVLEEMLRNGYNIGGEQSGHMIFTDFATTGDGELTAVKFMEMLVKSGKKPSELAGEIEIFPQVMINVPVANDKKAGVSNHPQVQKIAAEIATTFGEKGRVLIRPSGTEAKVRVMVEGNNLEQVEKLARKAADIIQKID